MNTMVGLVLAAAFVVGNSSARAQDPMSTAVRDAQTLSDCIKALDSACVVAMSDVEAYQRLDPPGSSYADMVGRMYQVMKERGRKYVQADIDSPTLILKSDERLYTFIPYIQVMDFEGKLNRVVAYFVGTSTDAGQTWKFFDGFHVSPDNIQRIVPVYSGQALPPVDPHEKGQ